MSRAAGAFERDFIVGRQDLLIPTVDQASPPSVSRFFGDLWLLNGLVQVDTFGRSGYETVLRNGLEVVLPATETKPLVSIRSSYRPTGELERLREASRQPGNEPRTRSVTAGYLRHEIVRPPVKGTAWDPIVTYSEACPINKPLGPGSQFTIAWGGRVLSEQSAKDVIGWARIAESPFNYAERVQAELDKQVRYALENTIELLVD